MKLKKNERTQNGRIKNECIKITDPSRRKI